MKKSTAQWRTLYLFHFRSFLENAPRTGALQKAIDQESAFPDVRDRLVRLYYMGELSEDLQRQFQSWLEKSL